MVLAGVVSGSMLGSAGAGAAASGAGASAAGAGAASPALAQGVPSPTGAAAGEGSIGSTSQALTSSGPGAAPAGAQASGTPHGAGAGAGTGQQSSPFQSMGKEMQKDSPLQFGSSSYNALFGINLPQGPAVPQTEIAPINAPAIGTPQAASANMAAPMAAPQMPAPMPVNMQAPMLMPVNPIPPPTMAPPMSLGSATMSDRNSKKNINRANKQIDQLLNDIYQEVLARKGNK